MGVARITLLREGERPLFLWNKSLPLAPPSFRTNPKAGVAVVQRQPYVEEQRLLTLVL